MSPLLPAVGIGAIALVAGVLLWFGYYRAPSGKNTNTGANTNTGSVVGPTGAAEPNGTDLAVNATVGGSTLQLVKAFRAADFAVAHAGEGKEFIVVLFRQLPGDATVAASAASAASLRAGSATYHPRSINLPSASDSQSNGSLVFEIPSGQASLTLTLGSKSAIPLNLPLP
jgi:hypothetical protein